LSISQQSVRAEHIIIDGGSTDGTAKLLEKWSDKLATVVSEHDQGPYDGMNKGIGCAQSEVVGVLNADDFYPNDCVLKYVAEVFSDPRVQACYGDLNYVAAEDTYNVVREWRSGEFEPEDFLYGWMPPHPTFFVRRNVYEELGLYRLDLGSAADYELMLRFLFKHRIRTAYIPKVLVHMRTGGKSNASLFNRLRANRNDKKAWEVNGLKPRPWTFVAKPLRKVGQWF
jgi:glycosyltransferase involved in cell wall biosynthesis